MTDIQNIGSTEDLTQLVIHVVHGDEISIHPSLGGESCGIIILVEDTTNLVDDQAIAQVILLLTKCNPDSIDIQHINKEV